MSARDAADRGEDDIASASLPEFGAKRTRYEQASAPVASRHIRLRAVQETGEEWGSGYDEGFPTRELKLRMKHMGADERAAVFSQRFPTKHLVFPSKSSDPSVSPLAGHTPAIKHTAAVPGTKNSVTTSHSERDQSRWESIQKTIGDALPSHSGFDEAVMARLATHRYMSSPKSELDTVKSDTAAFSKPLFMAHARVGDLRHPANFEEMTQIVHQQREKHKWETASILALDPASHSLVPPVMGAFLHASGNDPVAAMESFRARLHTPPIAGVSPPQVNTSVQSDTEDLRHVSLQSMRNNPVAPGGGRRRALSDARPLAPVRPAEVV